MIIPACDEILSLSGEYDIIPICREIYADVVTPITLLRRIAEQPFLPVGKHRGRRKMGTLLLSRI